MDRWIDSAGERTPGTLMPIMARLRLRFAFFALVLAACGSRTGLFIDDTFGPNPSPDGGNPVDGGVRDGQRDGLPEEDALPPIDAKPPVDVNRNDCPDAAITFIYLISSSYQLYSFNPVDSSLKLIGNIVCPAPSTDTPFSMAVDRKGVAYILFTDEHIYKVSTLNASCQATGFQPRQSNFGLFGMGFATNDVGPTETLYVSGDPRNAASAELARIDVSNFKLTPIGSPGFLHAELTGTGSNRLFGFYTRTDTSPPSYIGEIDTDTATVIAEKRLDTVDQGTGWAFAFWGGDFYMFHAPNGNPVVTRYRPADDSVTQITTLPTVIVGAGVSTCAPQ